AARANAALAEARNPQRPRGAGDLEVDEEDPPEAASPKTSSTRSAEDGQEVRINLLEKRCATLQKRLRTHEAAALASSTVAMPSSRGWELKVAAAFGPKAAAVAVRFHGNVYGLLRSFTERLLKSEPWLWLFYAHLLVLYTIAAYCYVQTAPDAASPIDGLNLRLVSAGAAGPKAAGAAAEKGESVA
ncbi:unnamed protein product, partial [Polarella glacialis]